MKLRLGPLGAPLAIILAWVAMRVAVLMPPPDVAAPPLPARRQADRSAATSSDARPEQTTRSRMPDREPNASPAALRSRRSWVVANTKINDAGPMPNAGIPAPAVAEVATSSPPFIGRSGVVAGFSRPARQPRRAITGSGWVLVNGTGGAVGIPSLGGSQAGFRLFLQGQSAPIALTARFSRALGAGRDTEVSAGYALRGRAFGLLVERRERLDTKSGAFVLTGYGGVYDVKLPAGLRFDGFAQGGLAGLRQRRWFADGQARVTERAVLSSQLSLGAGGGAWASAQQGASRVEAGPLVEARIRTGAIGLRVAGEYRFRVTGDANPRSGPALTVGVDF